MRWQLCLCVCRRLAAGGLSDRQCGLVKQLLSISCQAVDCIQILPEPAVSSGRCVQQLQQHISFRLQQFANLGIRVAFQLFHIPAAGHFFAQRQGCHARAEIFAPDGSDPQWLEATTVGADGRYVPRAAAKRSFKNSCLAAGPACHAELNTTCPPVLLGPLHLDGQLEVRCGGWLLDQHFGWNVKSLVQPADHVQRQ